VNFHVKIFLYRISVLIGRFDRYNFSVRLISWNCQGAFRKKYSLIARFKPDLAVIQECEDPHRIPWKMGCPPNEAVWCGDNPTRGLGIFSWAGLTFQPLEQIDETIRYCLPLQVRGSRPMNLIAVWAMDHRDRRLSYSAQIYQAIAIYREFIQSAETLFVGDFNSSKKTTPRSRIGNHATLTTALEDFWLVSAYHHFFHEKQGKELHGTFYRGRKPDKPAHIDFAYIPVAWLRVLRRVQVGDPTAWLEHSDHCPLIVDVDLPDERDEGSHLISSSA
jgi:exonuclease III